jgi:hypothetical protein
LAVPFAAGVIALCAVARPSVVIGALAPWLSTAAAAAVAVSAGWLPLHWFVSSGLQLAVAALAGGIVGWLIADQRLRTGVAVIAALIPALAAKYESPVATAELPVTATIAVLVHAPAPDVWQELIGSDTVDFPRPFTIRRARFADGSIAIEHIVEWDDAEHLRVVASLRPMKAPRGLEAWRTVRNDGAVVSTGATFELASSGDSATTLTMTRTYRMAIYATAYPASWLGAAASKRASAELGALAARSEASVRSTEPRLTAEMRVLRAALLRDLQEQLTSRGELVGHEVMFINGAREVELPEDLPAPEPLDPSHAAGSLRAFLRRAANRARTTAWMHTSLGAGDSTSTLSGDTLRFEFEDFEGRCVAESTPIAFARDASSLTLGVARRTRCVQTVMDDRTRRSRLIAQLPISAGRIEDSWSVALAATGSLRVYRDSVVVRADTVRLKAKPLDGAAQTVDSIVAGLSLGGERSWSIVKRSAAVRLDTVFAAQQEWVRTRQRFTIPIDSAFPLERSWPSFEVILKVPKTADNPYGVAWTYAHAPLAYFKDVRR